MINCSRTGRKKPLPSTANRATLAFTASAPHVSDGTETTLGDLIVALTDETNRLFRDHRKSYALVAHLLSERLKLSCSTHTVDV